MNKIKLFSIILPRLEVFFLEEWIDHYLSLGVDEISLYDNGEFPVGDKNAYWKGLGKNELDRRNSFRAAPEEMCWESKPHLNYNHDIEYKEILERLKNIEDKYNQVKVISWVHGKDHSFGYPTSQFKMIRKELENTNGNWALNVDPDEFLTLNQNSSILDFIKSNKDFNYFQFWPMHGESRQVGKSIRELKVLNEVQKMAPKWMCNPCDDLIFNTNLPHEANYKNKKAKICQKNEAYFYHYKLDGVIGKI